MTTRGQSFEIDRKKSKANKSDIFRGLKILELTASGKSNLPIRELAKEANLPRSIVLPMLFRLTQTWGTGQVDHKKNLWRPFEKTIGHLPDFHIAAVIQSHYEEPV